MLSRQERNKSNSLKSSKNLLAVAVSNILLEIRKADQYEVDLAINHELNHLAMSHKNGDILIKTLNNLDKVLFELTETKETVEWIEYSYASDFLAVGSHDDLI